MKRITLALATIGIIALFAFVTFLPVATAPQASFAGPNTNQLIGGFPYFLAGSGVSSSGTSITLTSFTLPQTGYEILTSDLSTPFYITFEPGSTGRQEFASCTTVTQNPSNTTAVLSGCTRGLLPIAPYTANSSYAFSHSGGTTVIFSNSPQFYQQFLALGNVATSTNILIFSSTTPPRYDNVGVQGQGSAIATTAEFASVAYVNATAVAGAPNASTAVKGIAQIATGTQAASSTLTGSTGAILVLGNGIATDTPTTLSATRVLMSDLTGHLKQAWLDLTAAWTWSGLGTFSGGLTSTATTTLAGSNVNSNAVKINTVAYQFPASQGAASTFIQNNGSGVLSWQPISRIIFATTTTATIVNTGGTAITTTIPGGAMGTTGGIRGRFYATWNTQSSAAMGLVLVYGGTTCVTTGTAATGNTTNDTFNGYINFTILNVNASSQVCDMSFQGSQNSANVTTAAPTMGTAGNGTAAVNSASNQTLSVTVTQNSAGQTLTIIDGTIEQIF